MTGNFIRLQHSTCNWTTKHSYLTHEIKCQCPLEKLRRQQIDLIDLLSSLFEEGLQLSQLDISAAQCSLCFGPAEGEVKVSPNKPDFIIAMDGNFQHRHQSYSSKDFPQEDQYPDFFIRTSNIEKEAVACQQTDAQANDIKVKEGSGKIRFSGEDIMCILNLRCVLLGLWLLRRYRNAVKVLGEAQSALNTLFQMANPALPGKNYSALFFRSQWASEREAYASKDAIMQKQKLELGRLLSLQDELEAAWLQPALTPQQALHRLRTTAEIKESIAQQAAKVGTANVLLLDKEQQAFLKLWYSKHEVGLRYIAICEEKRPLQQSRSDGHDTNLGHKGQTNLLVALRKHVTQLKKIVETYQTRRTEYHAKYPEHQLPADINYNELLHIQADHPFWNDSLFTKIEAPWAVDPNTRHGMQQVAYAD
ncbi:uncharacterized protein MELLADRAFT_106193 [Melampsora larici-populina 98AG31]|uniref:CxC1-like cysteine cluster associated with KDZ transposases domain-containing protein n=1 Tax=Melampsora larici-populina (strain 98AG31 / pathotype 3-4-7) TaxID=747676 RepID=F4RKQ6_MELLP|nr:uncharacterized protein MELLADRAFT_106193 [Melampsora larici-populina 98AG31]EGG07133.1 hypothetical protein MELLADRAFT_106193 [Melampsora larici-populina 98AG31]